MAQKLRNEITPSGAPLVDRRTFIGTGVMGAIGLTVGGVLSSSTYNDAAQRVANSINARVTEQTRAEAFNLAARNGWVVGSLPSLALFNAVIAAEFRTGKTVLIDGMRFSQTETAWYITLANGGE